MRHSNKHLFNTIFCLFIIIFFMSSLTALRAQNDQKFIELILDASGSMNGKLPGGETKIAGAKKAVKLMIQELAETIQLAFRAYGHQFHRDEHNCQDTELLVSFAPVSQICQDVIKKSQNLVARGYTPITHALKLASEDFPEEIAGEKIIILVSDGKETCDGDPCALAASLKANDIELVIHCIGFGVDAATKGQLECIAHATGGTYFDAADTEELITVLNKAVNVQGEATSEESGSGWLAIEKPDLLGHDVIDAKSGEKLNKSISRSKTSIEVPAGIYNVTFGKFVWKSIEVKKGQTTTIVPGWISIKNATLRGHKIHESETGILFGSVSRSNSSMAILPGKYDVSFGKTSWHITVKAGETTELNPGTVTVKGAHYSGHKIRDDQETVVGSVSNTGNWMPLPPGKYSIEIDEKVIPFTLEAGQDLEFERN